MKTKKGEFDIQSFLITFVLFIGIMVTLGLFSADVNDKYQSLSNNTIDPSFTATYNKLSSLQSKTEEIEQKVVETQTGTADSSTEFLGDAIASLKMIVPALLTTNVMIDDMARSVGVPPIWLDVLGLVMIIMLITVIIFMIFRYR